MVIRHGLTAAHCGIHQDAHRAFLGTRKLYDENNGLILKLEYVDNHPSYDSDTSEADIALVTFYDPPEPIQMKTMGIYPMRIRWHAYKLPLKQKVFAIGVGSTEVRKRAPGAATLRNATLFKHDSKRCVRHFFWASVASDAICCRGKRKKTVCRGDSGGPILWYKKTKNSARLVPYLLGIISLYSRPPSHPNTDCVPSAPMMATKVDGYKAWIEERVGDYARW